MADRKLNPKTKLTDLVAKRNSAGVAQSPAHAIHRAMLSFGEMLVVIDHVRPLLEKLYEDHAEGVMPMWETTNEARFWATYLQDSNFPELLGATFNNDLAGWFAPALAGKDY